MPLTAWEHSRRLLETPNGPFQSFSRLNPGQPERHQGGRKDQGGRKGSIGQPARQHQGGTREVGKNHLDSLGGHPGGRKVSIGQPARHQGGTREAPGRQERTIWTAWEAPVALVRGTLQCSGAWRSLPLADYWSHLALVCFKVFIAKTLESHARGGAPPQCSGRGAWRSLALVDYWNHLALPGLLHLL